MKIVDLQAFLLLPEGTLFQKCEPQCFGPIEIFSGSLAPDFVSVPLSEPEFEGAHDMDDISAAWDIMLAGGSVPLEYGEASGRDGLFEQAQLFAIYEKQDVERLIGCLQEQLAKAY